MIRMSGGGTALVTMRPDESPLNGDTNHSFSAISDSVVNRFKHDMCKSLKDSDSSLKSDLPKTTDRGGNESVGDNTNCSDELSTAVETNGHGKIESDETKTSAPDEAGDGNNCVEDTVCDSNLAVSLSKAESDEAKDPDSDKACNGELSNVKEDVMKKKNDCSKSEGISKEKSDGSAGTAQDIASEAEKEISASVVSGKENSEVVLECNDTLSDKKQTDVEKVNGSETDKNVLKSNLSIHARFKNSVSELVKKAVDSVKKSGRQSGSSTPTGTKTPPLDAEDVFYDAKETTTIETKDSPVVNENRDPDLMRKVADEVDCDTKSEAAKDTNVTNCDKDNCEDIPESLLDEDDEKSNEKSAVKVADDEDILNEDELLMELDTEKQNDEAEPDASLLNESDHEDQTNKKSDGDSVVVLSEDEDVQVEKMDTTPSNPTAESKSEIEAESEVKVIDEVKVVDKVKPESELEVIDEVKPVGDTNGNDKDKSTECSEKPEVEEDKASKSLEEDKPKKEIVDLEDKHVNVEDVDSDYEVMEISLDDMKPLKSQSSRSVSMSSKCEADDDSKESLSRKRAVPSSDADDTSTTSSTKRTKLGTDDKVEDKSSRCSTPDSVVCLPSYSAPAKEEFKPVCAGDKKLINDKAFSELVRIKLNQCLMREIETVVAPLRKRVSELQASNEAWKSQASELQKKILELNIALQRKERKRKAHRNDKIKAQQAKAAAAAAAAASAKASSPVVNTPPKSQFATNPTKQVMLGNVNKPIQSASVLQNNIQPIQLQAPNSQYQTIQIPMSVSNQIRNVIGQQPTIANVQLTSATTAQGINPSASNILQYVNRSGIIQGSFAPNTNSTALPIRGVLESTPTGTSFAATPVALQQNTTVRSMLSTKRDGQPTLVMMPNTVNTTQQKPVAQQTLLKVPNIQTANNTTKNINQNQVFVDLTDDDDASARKIAQPVPTGVTANSAIALRPQAGQTIPPQGVNMPVRPGQITLRPGTQIVLNGSTAGPMFFQPLPTQRMAATGTVQSKPQTFIYAPTTLQSQGNRVLTLLPQQATANSSTTLVSTRLAGATPIQTSRIAAPTPQVTPIQTIAKHPAPLPPKPSNPMLNTTKKEPPKPALKISRVSQGIVLSWNMQMVAALYEEIASYQLYAYQETASAPSTTLWKKVGDVKALPLPMACTLTQFQEGNRYHFAVRAIDVHHRVGPFSEPSSIHLTKNS